MTAPPSTPCLWLPGWATSPSAFAALQAGLPPGYRHVAVDFGTAAQPADFAAVATAALPPAGPPAVLIGWSLGALVALRLATQYPRRVRALVWLAGTPCFTATNPTLGWPPKSLALMQRALGVDHAKVLRAFGDKMTAPAPATPAPAVGESWTLDALDAGLSYLATTDLSAAWRGYRGPVLWVHGGADAIIPAGVFQRWRVDLGGSTQHQWALLPGVGHALPWQAPAAVLAALLPFLAHHAPAESPDRPPV